MIKDFLIKKMLKAKLGKSIPDSEIDKVVALVKENPALFQKIGNEIQEKIKQGKNQQTATMEVMTAHKDELQKLNLTTK